jgi:hypothetical protein
MPVTQEDVTAGLVVTLDTAVLRARGGALTNAVLGPAGDRAVVGEHDFLVLHVDAPSGLCTAVPLFPKSAVGNQPLEAAHRVGAPGVWGEGETYFSCWQHWRIPVASVVVASAVDATVPAMRRQYAPTNRSALDDIRNWEGRNRAAYRPA